MNLKLDLT